MISGVLLSDIFDLGVLVGVLTGVLTKFLVLFSGDYELALTILGLLIRYI